MSEDYTCIFEPERAWQLESRSDGLHFAKLNGEIPENSRWFYWIKLRGDSTQAWEHIYQLPAIQKTASWNDIGSMMNPPSFAMRQHPTEKFRTQDSRVLFQFDENSALMKSILQERSIAFYVPPPFDQLDVELWICPSMGTARQWEFRRDGALGFSDFTKEFAENLFRPSAPNLASVRSCLAQVQSVDDAWESLIAHELIPSSWANLIARGYVEKSTDKPETKEIGLNCLHCDSVQFYQNGTARPLSIEACATLAANPQGILQAEAIAREVAITRWGFTEKQVQSIWWAFVKPSQIDRARAVATGYLVDCPEADPVRAIAKLGYMIDVKHKDKLVLVAPLVKL